MTVAGSMLQVSMGEPLAVSRSAGYHWFPTSLLKMRDGSIHLEFSLGPDEYPEDLTMVRGASLISRDMGTTWYFNRHLYLHDGQNRIQLIDGTVLRYSGEGMIKKSGEAFTWGWRSSDNGKTFEGPLEVPLHFPEEASLNVPPHFPAGTVTRVVYPGQGGRHVGRVSAEFYLDSGIVQLDNGDLLNAASCRFKGD